MADGGKPICGMSSYRQPRYLRLSLETGSFASPPRGGFAYSTTQRSKTSAENNAIHTDLSSDMQLVASGRRRSLATVNLALQIKNSNTSPARVCGRRMLNRHEAEVADNAERKSRNSEVVVRRIVYGKPGEVDDEPTEDWIECLARAWNRR